MEECHDKTTKDHPETIGTRIRANGSHAVKKAKDNQMRDAQAFVESPIARELLGPEN